MELFQTRLFFRIVFKSREVYFLKIITLAIAFSCSILILLFSISEFGYDRFHEDYKSIFRILQRNNNESYIGNHLSNGIPEDVFTFLKSNEKNLMIFSRLKLMKELSIKVDKKVFHDSKFYAADSEIVKIFSFDVLHGSLQDFQQN